VEAPPAQSALPLVLLLVLLGLVAVLVLRARKVS
jgi:MYXO-CTERM domain-containing protein